MGSGDGGHVKHKEMKTVEEFEYNLLLHMPLLFLECIPYVIKGPYSTFGEWTNDLEWTMPLYNIWGDQNTCQFQTLIIGSCDLWEVIASAGTHRNSVWERTSKLCVEYSKGEQWEISWNVFFLFI